MDISPIRVKRSIWRKIRSLKDFCQIRKVVGKQEKALLSLKEKKTIKCVFMAIDISAWKYDEVVKRMNKDPRFETIILVCPMVNQGEKIMLSKMKQAVSFYKEKGYNVISSYNESDGSYVNLRSELKPDILFYTNPYYGMIDDRYYITNFTDILTVYVSYYFTCSIDMNFNTNVQLYNIVWRKYVENDYVKNICQKYARNHGRNVVVTGYPGIEALIDKHPHIDLFNKDNRKRIIWAPHHTLDECVYGHSCFIMYADFFLQMAEKYKDDVILIFKPHPLLKGKLYKVWGERRTLDYYEKWNMGTNTAINEGEYVNLFLSSDAMIHDSGSFVVEYLYVNKPVMRTINDIPLEKQFNEFALSCLDNYYKAYNEHDIEQFIQNVIKGVDSLKEQRTKFVNEKLMPKGSPSQNIIDDILDSIHNQILYRN